MIIPFLLTKQHGIMRGRTVAPRKVRQILQLTIPFLKQHEDVTHQMIMVSEAKAIAGSKIVTKSDEAFGLLLIEYYLGKWKKRLVTGTG